MFELTKVPPQVLHFGEDGSYFSQIIDWTAKDDRAARKEKIFEFNMNKVWAKIPDTLSSSFLLKTG